MLYWINTKIDLVISYIYTRRLFGPRCEEHMEVYTHPVYGVRCEEYMDGCPVCDAWRTHDDIFG